MMLSRRFSTYRKAFTINDINQHLLNAEYAVRGAIPTRAEAIKEEIRKDPLKYPFKEIVQLNIGNPLIFTQPPIPFLRSVIAGTLLNDNNPSDSLLGEPKNPLQKLLAETPILRNDYDRDIWKLVEEYKNNVNTHQYTLPGGESFIRNNVARFISRRDGIDANADTVILTNGASVGIKICMDFLVDGPQDGIMVPIPQYPLYSALITLLNASQVSYFLNEEDGWSINYAELDRSVNESRKKGVQAKAIVIINPGNPTGNVIKRNRIEEIIRFAFDNDLIVLADEVYQENIYNGNEWFSFRKVLLEMEPEVAENTRLISYHSLSKGIFGECGLRGGFMDFTNFDNQVMKGIMDKQKYFYPNLAGQIAIDFKCRYLSGLLNDIIAPQTLFNIDNNYNQAFNSLQLRANKATDMLNSMKNVTSNAIDGAMYAFPRLHLPEKFITAAKRKKQQPDASYCMELLENTGICVVPGSGFGQKEGTYHLRTTILPQPDDYFVKTFERFKEFNDGLMTKYSD